MSRHSVLEMMEASVVHLTNPAAITLSSADGMRHSMDAVADLIAASVIVLMHKNTTTEREWNRLRSAIATCEGRT